VPAPLQPLREGQPIEPGLLGTVWVAESQLPPDVVLAADAVVGREAERRLAPGRPIRQGDLRPARLVRKGEIVTLIFQRGPIELTAQARALQDGAEGERIRAVNLDSERPVSGLVIGRRRLLVGTAEVGR
jgi:flagella basal body P-ring formation protein FlgA